jgi:aldose 1-epimerase
MPDGTPVHRVELHGGGRARVAVITLGATLQGAWAPDRDGVCAPVVLGADTLGEYLDGFPAAGATVGRVANRIARARFTIEGREYRLPANDGPNSLHGGPGGFAHRVWSIEHVGEGEGIAWARLILTSPDGDQGYPGTVTTTVRYALDDDDELILVHEAVADRPTPFNPTNHAYFNLAGSGDVLGHVLWMDADRWTPVDAGLIPTGAVEPVAGTPLDFTAPAPLGGRVAALAGTPARGLDHNLVLRAGRDSDRPAAWLEDPASGRRLVVHTTQPAVQLYSGNQLGRFTAHGGRTFDRHGGVCLETQHYPDAVHHPEFPSIVLAPGRTFRSTTRYRFEVAR